VGLAAESLRDVPTNRISSVVNLRPKLEIGAQARPFRQRKHFDAVLIAKLPDD
jgi:hypothetical protein